VSGFDAQPYFPREQFGSVGKVEPITMGMSGAGVYAVTTTTGSYVLRIHAKNSPQDAAAWRVEMAKAAMAAEAGVAPALIGVHEQALATIWQRVDGVPIGRALGDPAQRDRAFASVARQLASLHALPVKGISGMDPVAMGTKLWATQAHRPGFPAWAQGFSVWLERAAVLLARDARRVFSHNDPNPANILWDGRRAIFVDWEQSGPAHPYLDAATFANFLSLPDEAAVGLIGGEVDRDTLGTLRAMSRVIYGAGFCSLVPDLAAVAIPAREQVLPLGEFYARYAKGEVDMASPEGRAQFGAALLREVPA
jgi:aminoglycoside phosphotransferase (APT) family kinase protein